MLIKKIFTKKFYNLVGAKDTNSLTSLDFGESHGS